MDMIDIAIAKAFATKVAAGFSNVEVDGMTINFTLNDGTTTSLTVPTPADGVSVTDIDINENGNLICTMSDGTEIDAGKVTPTKGVDYYTPEEIEEVKEDILTDLQGRIDLLTSEYTATTSENSDNIIIENAINYYNQGNIKIGDGPELEQYTSTGKNLFNKNTITSGYRFNADGTTFSDSARFISDYISSQAETNYVFNKSRTKDYDRIIYYDSSKEYISAYSGQVNPVTTPANTAYIRFAFELGGLDGLMLEQGTTPSETYEPYTNGQPAPSPDYPQTMEVVEGAININISNENLFNKTSVNFLKTYIGQTSRSISTASDSNNFRTYYIECSPNTLYYLKRFTVSSPIIAGCCQSLPTKGTPLDNYKSANSSTAKLSIRTSFNSKYLVFQVFTSESGYTLDEVLNDFYIGKTDVEPTKYIPHKGQTYPITLPTGMFLGAIEEASNYIYGTKDNWKLHSGLAKTVYDGTESGWSLHSTYTDTIDFDRNVSGRLYNSPIKTNLFLNSRTTNTEGIDSASYNAHIYPRLFLSREITTVSDFKSWLGENNLIVYYILATPTDVAITDTTLITQLNDIADNLQTYKDKTIVFTSGGSLVPNIQFDYFTNLNESSSNKVINISSESTDEQYPSAKAVYDYIETKLANLNN